MTYILDKQRIRLKINLGYVCNYRCSYCFQDHDNFDQEEQKSYVSYNLSKLENILPKVLSNINNKYIEIIFIGGEPTLYNISSLMSKIYLENNKNFINFSFPTNLSNHSTIIREMAKFKNNLRIDASYHPEMVNFGVFKNKLKEIVDNGFKNIKTSLVLNKDTEKYVNDFLTLNKICKAKLSTERDKNKSYSSTNFLKNELKKNALTYANVFINDSKSMERLSREEIVEKYGVNGKLDFFGKYCFGALELNMINNTFFMRCSKERKKINYENLLESIKNFNFQICPRHECELCYVTAITDNLDELKEAYSVLYKRN